MSYSLRASIGGSYRTLDTETVLLGADLFYVDRSARNRSFILVL